MTTCAESLQSNAWASGSYIDWSAVEAGLRADFDQLTNRYQMDHDATSAAQDAELILTCLEMMYGPDILTSYFQPTAVAGYVQHFDLNRLADLFWYVMTAQKKAGAMPSMSSGTQGWWFRDPTTPDHCLVVTMGMVALLRRNPTALDLAMTGWWTTNCDRPASRPLPLEHKLLPSSSSLGPWVGGCPSDPSDWTWSGGGLTDLPAWLDLMDVANAMRARSPVPGLSGENPYLPNFWGELIGVVPLFQMVCDRVILLDPNYASPFLTTTTGMGAKLFEMWQVWRQRAVPRTGSGAFVQSGVGLGGSDGVLGPPGSLPAAVGIGSFTPATPGGVLTSQGSLSLGLSFTLLQPTFADAPALLGNSEGSSPVQNTFCEWRGAPPSEPELVPQVSPLIGQDWDCTLHQLTRAVVSMYQLGWVANVDEGALILWRLHGWAVKPCETQTQLGQPAPLCAEPNLGAGIPFLGSPTERAYSQHLVRCEPTRVGNVYSPVIGPDLVDAFSAALALVRSGLFDSNMPTARQLGANILASIATLYRPGTEAGWTRNDPNLGSPSLGHDLRGTFPAIASILLLSRGPFQGACNPAGLPLGYAPLPGLDGFLHFSGGHIPTLIASGAYPWPASFPPG